MKYFFDTEFIEKPCTIDLISIGMVCEDGREFYAESNEVDWTQAHPWVLNNVKDHLTGAYYADYDWVALCWLFGSMVNLPSFYPKFCMDLKQWNVQLGERELPKQEGVEHHALADARWLRDTWKWMDGYLASGDW